MEGHEEFLKCLMKFCRFDNTPPSPAPCGAVCCCTDGPPTPQIEQFINRIEKAVKSRHAKVTTLFVKPQTGEAWRALQHVIARENAPRG